MLQDIIALHQSGDLEAAESGYRSLIEQEPGNADALHLLGLLRQQRGAIDEAGNLIERALASAPERGEFHYSLGGLRLAQGRADDARAEFERATVLNPNLGAAHAALAQLALADGRPDLAEKHLQLAERVNPDALLTLQVRGALLSERGDQDGAIRVLQRVLDRTPNDVAALLALGRAFLRRGLGAFAEQTLARVLELDPGNRSAQVLTGESMMRNGKLAEAREVFEKILDTHPNHTAALTCLGDIARQEGNHTAAIEYLSSSLEHDPRQRQALALLGNCARSLGRPDIAFEPLKRYLQMLPQDVQAWRTLATLSLELNRMDEVAGAYRGWLEQESSIEARVGLAAALERLGHFDAANEQAEAALKLDAAEPVARLILARAALRTDDAASAGKHLGAMSVDRLNPAQMRSRQGLLGQVRAREGKFREALGHWQAQRTGDPLPLPDLRAASTPQVGEAGDEGPAHRFLLGAPGSGVETIAAWLNEHRGTFVLADRFRGEIRADWIAQPAYSSWAGELSPQRVEELRAIYAEGLGPLANDPRTLIDWLPAADAALAPALAALEGTRLLWVTDDPRDCLLNWLALGGLHGLRPGTPEDAANWLAKVLEHQANLADALATRVVRVELGKLNKKTVAAITQSAGLEAEMPKPATTLGGLPARLPAGAWRDYSDVLGEAFKVLAPIAKRLGYKSR